MATLDEAIIFTLNFLRRMANQQADRRGESHFGYEMYVPKIARQWAIAGNADDHERDRTALEASPAFFEAAWELCRRGLIRPGIRKINEQAIADGGGYC